MECLYYFGEDGDIRVQVFRSTNAQDAPQSKYENETEIEIIQPVELTVTFPGSNNMQIYTDMTYL